MCAIAGTAAGSRALPPLRARRAAGPGSRAARAAAECRPTRRPSRAPTPGAPRGARPGRARGRQRFPGVVGTRRGSSRLRESVQRERPQTSEAMGRTATRRNLLARNPKTIDALRAIALQYPQAELRQAHLRLLALEGGPFQPVRLRSQTRVALHRRFTAACQDLPGHVLERHTGFVGAQSREVLVAARLGSRGRPYAAHGRERPIAL